MQRCQGLLRSMESTSSVPTLTSERDKEAQRGARRGNPGTLCFGSESRDNSKGPLQMEATPMTHHQSTAHFPPTQPPPSGIPRCARGRAARAMAHKASGHLQGYCCSGHCLRLTLLEREPRLLSSLWPLSLLSLSPFSP